MAGCSSLTSITIPSSVTRIGSGAFNGCAGLISITFHNSKNWYLTGSSGYSGGDLIDLSTPATNATYFTSTYSNEYYWYKN